MISSVSLYKTILYCKDKQDVLDFPGSGEGHSKTASDCPGFMWHEMISGDIPLLSLGRLEGG